MQCFSQCTGNIHLLWRDFVSFHNEMMKHFHHRSEITLFSKFSRVHVHQLKQFIGVHQVKISCESKIARRNCMALYEWMTKFNIVLSLCAVAQMTKQQFAKKRKMSFHQAGVFTKIG